MDERSFNIRSALYALEIQEEEDRYETIRSLVIIESSKLQFSNSHSLDEPFFLPDLIDLEQRASQSGTVEDYSAVWSIPLYSQRKYWFKLFIGFNYGILAAFLTNWTMRGIPDPTYGDDILVLYNYLRKPAGIRPLEEILQDAKAHRYHKDQEDNYNSRVSCIVKHVNRSIRTISSFKLPSSHLSLRRLNSGFRLPSITLDIGKQIMTADRKESRLTEDCRQSKLSQEQLSELQRSTHFDKKELQQWYKGKRTLTRILCSILTLI